MMREENLMGQMQKLTPSNPVENQYLVRIWPDNSWAVVDDIKSGEYDWKSDDYRDVDMYNVDDLNGLDAGLLQELLVELLGAAPPPKTAPRRYEVSEQVTLRYFVEAASEEEAIERAKERGLRNADEIETNPGPDQFTVSRTDALGERIQ